jgi:hypothetical protein
MNMKAALTRTSVASVIALAAIVTGLGNPNAANAAVGSISGATIGCDSSSLLSNFRTIVYGYSPWVRAANTTTSVDRQTVYWRVRVVEERVAASGARSYVALTGWNSDTVYDHAWATANVVDNAWTSLFSYQGKATNTFYWTLPFAGGLTTRLVENEVWFYDTRSGWNYGGNFYSGPSATSGKNYNIGYCS